MKGLTIWQPWASLIMSGAKRYEFRKRPAPKALVGQRIVIHAGSRQMQLPELLDLRDRLESGETALEISPAMELLERVLASEVALPMASGLGTAVLGEPRRAADIFPDVADSLRIDQHIWGWPLSEIRPFEPIVPARGFQGFWPWPHDIPEAA